MTDIARAFGISTQRVFKVRKDGNWQRLAVSRYHGTNGGLDRDGCHAGEAPHPPALPTNPPNQEPTCAAVAGTLAGLILQGLPTIVSATVQN
ncbi:MAG: hypothetical protein NTW21_06240 [Verrucomicrobia bacterium]|nr:hypothetical protein [Verrucomicrobiota bacterium]